MPTAAPGLIPPPPQPPPASAGRGTVVNPIAARIAAATARPRPVFPKNLPTVIYPPRLGAAARAGSEACNIRTSERPSSLHVVPRRHHSVSILVPARAEAVEAIQFA